MSNSTHLESKRTLIRDTFESVVGKRLIRYETAELLCEDGTWDNWPDLPIRLFTHTGQVVSISWSRFEDLWLARDMSLPFSIEGSTVRWVENAIEKIEPVLGKKFRSVLIGQGEMSIEEKDIEIWTRLLIQMDDVWLEIFNALDENGYACHASRPAGVFIPCI